MRQQTTQVFSRAAQARLHGSHFDIYSPRDFFKRKLFVLEHHQSLPLQWRQRLNGPRHEIRSLPSAWIERLRDEFFLILKLAPSLLRAPTLASKIPRHAEQKRPERPTFHAVTRRISEQRKEAFLQNVLGGFRRPGHAPSEAINRILVFAVGGSDLGVVHGSHFVLTSIREKDTMKLMTSEDFRRIALSLDGAEEGSHMGAVDFRVGGRIFSTLASVKQGYGNLMLEPDQQAAFVTDAPECFCRSREAGGAWE